MQNTNWTNEFTADEITILAYLLDTYTGETDEEFEAAMRVSRKLVTGEALTDEERQVVDNLVDAIGEQDLDAILDAGY